MFHTYFRCEILFLHHSPFSVTFVPTVTFCLVTVRFLSKREAKLRGWLEGSGRGKKDLISVALKLTLIFGNDGSCWFYSDRKIKSL